VKKKNVAKPHDKLLKNRIKKERNQQKK